MTHVKGAWKYWPLQAMLWCASRLPLRVLYVISDVLFLLIYYVLRYRRKVVAKHIDDSFPELSDKERKVIIRKFYRNFADYIVETIKLLHISDEQMRRRFTFEGMEIVDEILGQGRSIAAYFAHTGNWEWAPSITLWSRHNPHVDAEFCQVYRPLRNKWFDSLMLKLRGRFQPLSFAKNNVLRHLVELRRDSMPSITGFMSDQKPSSGDPTRPLMFLNHPTAFITGTEALARKLKMAVVYWDMHKPSRGHYHIVMRLITPDASQEPPMAITDTYAHLLEQTIRREPSIWLWSHKRWKRPVQSPVATPTTLPTPK
ncbi:MAG: lysophospholipid acyltransferase family protein [Muribaculaceae bacterium]|nr:lysophospholipid acyltransferase family protein [Muribaculaceae bacterium]MDE6320686.1 lysophospholipid acyltransferase family protein [Muribaculaceae bacterium]